MADNFAEGTVELKAIGLDQIETALTKAAEAAKRTTEDIANVEKALQRQVATFGLSSKAVQEWDLRAKGATKAQINGIMALTAQLDKLNAKQKQTADAVAAMNATKSAVKSVTDELKKQVATFGMSGDQIKIWELKQKGATTNQLLEVKKLQTEYAKLLVIQAKQATDAGVPTSPVAAAGGQAAGQQGGIYDRLKSLSRLSAGTRELMTGLAGVAGATMLADSLSRLSKEAVELKNAFDRGDISAGEFADRMARAVPIAGSLYAAITDSSQAFRDYASWAAKSAGASDKFASALESAATKAERAKQQFQAIKDLKQLSSELQSAGARIGDDQFDSQFAEAKARQEAAVSKAAELYNKGLDPNADRKKAAARLKAAKEAGVDPLLADEQYRRDMDATVGTRDEAKAKKASDEAVRRANENYEAEVHAIKLAREKSQRSDLESAGVRLPDTADSVDVDRAHQKMSEERSKVVETEIAAGAEPGVIDAIRERVKALEGEAAAWGKTGLAAERAMLVLKKAPPEELKKFDQAMNAAKAMDANLKSRQWFNREFKAPIGDKSVLTAAGPLKNREGGMSPELEDDFGRLIKQLEDNVKYQGMTESQMKIAQFREGGATPEQIKGLEKLYSLQEKKPQAGTDFMSASGVADYVQQAIGHVPDNRAALAAAKEAAAAATKQANCIERGAMNINIKSMPPVVAVYGGP